MNNFLIFFTSFFALLLCFLMLFNKIPEKFRKIAFAYILLFFFLFCFSIYISPDVKNFIQERKVKHKPIEKQMEPAKKQVFQKEETLLNAPLISQLPELPRGCEVTSLAMLLQFAGIKVEKMELAQQVKKDPTPFQMRNGQVVFGNPNVGFVGDMYNIDKPGYGVYHKPIKELAEKYLPAKVIDLTGKEFSEIETSISNGIPVWIIINTRYSKLHAEEFNTWNTTAGQIQMTYREHSVLITGYNKDYIFFNDPLTGEKNKKAPKPDFIKAWVQMGRQAITYSKD
ncbi:C39 family peptidase [Pseudobacillus badius]|uniref:C39 family peptidase n=1 Tax=Bacillus badius TaxID=1455 RepID=UPI003D33DC7C